MHCNYYKALIERRGPTELIFKAGIAILKPAQLREHNNHHNIFRRHSPHLTVTISWLSKLQLGSIYDSAKGSDFIFQMELTNTIRH